MDARWRLVFGILRALVKRVFCLGNGGTAEQEAVEGRRWLAMLDEIERLSEER